MPFWDRWSKKRELAPGEGEGSFRNGQRHGAWRIRDEKSYVEGLPPGLDELTYVDGVKTGPYSRYAGNGTRVERGSYVDGARHGMVSRWTEKGQLSWEGEFRAGKNHGRLRYFHPETASLRFESEYIDDQRNGPWKSFFADGTLEEQGAHVLGKRVGAWTLQHPDGSLRAQGMYVDGVPTGAWKLVDRGGEQTRELRSQEDFDQWEMQTWPADRVTAAVQAARMPPRSLTQVLDEETNDPRNRFITVVEPDVNLTPLMMQRFRERLSNLDTLHLTRMQFWDGILPLFATGYPQLRRLGLYETTAPPGDLAALYRLLGAADWVTALEELQISHCEAPILDEDAAALLGNEKLTRLRSLALGDVTLGPLVAQALAKRTALTQLRIYHSVIDLPTLAAIAKLPNLTELTIAGCRFPENVPREVVVPSRARDVSLQLEGDDSRLERAVRSAFPERA